MTFREKIDWLSIGAILLAFGWYVTVFPWHLRGTAALAVQGGLLIAVGIAMALVMTVAAIALALHRPREANAPADERDRAITRRATTRAYYVMIVGAVCSFAIGYWTRDLATAFNGLLASTILSELTRLISQVCAYRMGE